MKFLVTIFLLGFASAALCQYFDPDLDDKMYLDRIEEQINIEVERAAVELVAQTKVAEKITKSYITIKLKDNVFKALRTLAENEVVQLQSALNSRQVKQNQNIWHERQEETESSGSSAGGEASGGESGGGGETASGSGGEAAGGADEEEEPSTTPLNGLSTAVKINQNVFSFLGDAIKIIFKGIGGKSFPREAAAGTFSTTSDELVQAIPSLMRKPYAEQLVGILSLLSKDGEGGLSLANPNQAIQLNEKEEGNPLEFLFGKRQRPSTAQAGKASTSVGSTLIPVEFRNMPSIVTAHGKSAVPKPIFTTYVENLKRTQPWLLPDLYRGIPEANRLLQSMYMVVNGIKNEAGSEFP